jgi:hypothetical protein
MKWPWIVGMMIRTNHHHIISSFMAGNWLIKEFDGEGSKSSFFQSLLFFLPRWSCNLYFCLIKKASLSTLKSIAFL